MNRTLQMLIILLCTHFKFVDILDVIYFLTPELTIRNINDNSMCNENFKNKKI